MHSFARSVQAINGGRVPTMPCRALERTLVPRNPRARKHLRTVDIGCVREFAVDGSSARKSADGPRGSATGRLPARELAGEVLREQRADLVGLAAF